MPHCYKQVLNSLEIRDLNYHQRLRNDLDAANALQNALAPVHYYGCKEIGYF